MELLTQVTNAGLFMAGLGGLLAGLLITANRKLFVYEDPRIDEVEDLLPRANCGACGTPGCRPFAEGLVKGELEPALCTVNTKEGNSIIANYLGVDLGDVEKRVARLACAGGHHVARIRAKYSGLESCRAAAVVAGGGKNCTWGCLGLGDCADVCDFGAIHLDQYGVPQVDHDKCTACGDCVEICPKGLFSIQPQSHQLWIACKNQDFGEEAESDCELICTACERCAFDAPDGLIEIRNNIAVIDYEKNHLASPLPIERCPTGAIVWLESQQTRKGIKAKKVVRREALPVG